MRYALCFFSGLVFPVLFMGCEAEVAPLVTETDSGGVVLVTNTAERMAAGEAWSLSTQPVLELGGGIDAETPFLRVTAIEPLGSGRVAIATNAPPQVFVFNAQGALDLGLGRQGNGPGEYSSVFSLVELEADSVGVWDGSRRLLTVFSPDGSPGRTIDFSGMVPIPVGAAAGTDLASGFTRLLGAGPVGFILFGEGALEPVSEPTVTRPGMPSHWVDVDGRTLASSPPIPGMEVYLGSPIGPIPLPFGGRTFATSVGQNLVVATGNESSFAVYGPAGAVIRIVRWPDGPRDLSGPHLSTWDGMVNDLKKESPGLFPILEAIPRVEVLPPYLDVIASDQGEILVGDYPGPLGVWPMRRADDSPEILRPTIRMPARTWLVFDSAGAFKASFQAPEGLEPYLVDKDRVWGVFTDALDVESVRAYELIRQ